MVRGSAPRTLEIPNTRSTRSVPSTLTAVATCTVSSSLRHGGGKFMFLPGLPESPSAFTALMPTLPLASLGRRFGTGEVSNAELKPPRADVLSLWDDFRFIMIERTLAEPSHSL